MRSENCLHSGAVPREFESTNVSGIATGYLCASRVYFCKLIAADTVGDPLAYLFFFAG
jgi:hypothetical protein